MGLNGIKCKIDSTKQSYSIQGRFQFIRWHLYIMYLDVHLSYRNEIIVWGRCGTWVPVTLTWRIEGLLSDVPMKRGTKRSHHLADLSCLDRTTLSGGYFCSRVSVYVFNFWYVSCRNDNWCKKAKPEPKCTTNLRLLCSAKIWK